VGQSPISGGGCAPCRRGTYYSVSTKLCEECPPGTYSDTEGATYCELCPRGRYGEGGDVSSACSGACPWGHFCIPGTTKSKCPDNGEYCWDPTGPQPAEQSYADSYHANGYF
jgi:hypothetical protein